jgi:hypothetical protein
MAALKPCPGPASPEWPKQLAAGLLCASVLAFETVAPKWPSRLPFLTALLIQLVCVKPVKHADQRRQGKDDSQRAPNNGSSSPSAYVPQLTA